MNSIWEDFAGGIKALRSKPGFYALPVGILALGLGGAISLFSFINAWILQPIEYPDPDRLVYLGGPQAPRMNNSTCRSPRKALAKHFSSRVLRKIRSKWRIWSANN